MIYPILNLFLGFFSIGIISLLNGFYKDYICNLMD